MNSSSSRLSKRLTFWLGRYSAALGLYAIAASLLLAATNALAFYEEPPEPDHWLEAPERVVTVKAPYIDIRTFAGRGYPIYHVAEREEKLLIHKSRNNWFKVETLDGKIGWIARNDLVATVNSDNIPLDFTDEGWRDNSKYRMQLGLTAGSLEGAIAYSPYFSFAFTENIAVEAKYTQAFGDFSNLKIASLGVAHSPFPSWRLSPFFRLGSGVIQTNPSTVLVQSEDREDPIISVGGGFVFYLSSHFTLRVEYDKHTILTTRDVNEEVEEWKAGFGVLF